MLELVVSDLCVDVLKCWEVGMLVRTVCLISSSEQNSQRTPNTVKATQRQARANHPLIDMFNQNLQDKLPM